MLKAGFIRSARYEELLFIIPVIKKNGQIRICMDFRKLNLAMPKDEYVVPIANMLIDVVANNRY